MWEDTKVVIAHLPRWEKIALVTDHAAYVNDVKAFGWMVPGEIKVFAVADLSDAEPWVADSSDSSLLATHHPAELTRSSRLRIQSIAVALQRIPVTLPSARGRATRTPHSPGSVVRLRRIEKRPWVDR